MTAVLPTQFADLEKFVGEWALGTERERFEKRTGSSMQQMRPFYEAILPRAAEIFSYLSDRQLQDLSEQEETLLKLGLSYIEISRVFEVWNRTDVRADFFTPDKLRTNG